MNSFWDISKKTDFVRHFFNIAQPAMLPDMGAVSMLKRTSVQACI